MEKAKIDFLENPIFLRHVNAQQVHQLMHDWFKTNGFEKAYHKFARSVKDRIEALGGTGQLGHARAPI